jgi:hypothetical protein
MVHAARAALLAALIAQAAPSLASPLSSRLLAVAGGCFESPVPARCDAVWDLSNALKEQAERSDQLRCYTSVLVLESMVSMTKWGRNDPRRQQAALEGITKDCP